MDGNGLSDPYVKLFLLPGNRIVSNIIPTEYLLCHSLRMRIPYKLQHRFQTKTIYKNLDPVFDETFMFYSVSLEAMKTKQLW